MCSGNILCNTVHILLNCDVHLHTEIEMLKQVLVDKQNQLIAMETACLRETDRQVELEDSIIAWQDKYDRLYESHKRVQKVNQNLEDKLLKLVDRKSNERAQLTSDVATISVRLAQANYNIANLQREIERYKGDMSLAIKLLQCKPESFVAQKITSLPVEIQSKVTQYMRLDSNSHSDSEGSVSGIGTVTSSSYRVLPASDSPPPMCPFPPTAMVYSMRGLDANNQQESNNQQQHQQQHQQQPQQYISPSIMAKYLEDELKLNDIKHCDTCLCSPNNRDLTVLADDTSLLITSRRYTVGTQTLLHGDANNSLCLRCNSNLNSPSRTNSPYIMKLVKSSDSVISETKSSVSDLNDVGTTTVASTITTCINAAITTDKLLFTSTKKEQDLMVNPILGHHRLCDRTVRLDVITPITLTNTRATPTIITNYSNTLVTNKIDQQQNTGSKKSPLKLVSTVGGGKWITNFPNSSHNNNNKNSNSDISCNSKIDSSPNICDERSVRTTIQDHIENADQNKKNITSSTIITSTTTPTVTTCNNNIINNNSNNGSTNSLWSKSSTTNAGQTSSGGSIEGLKMFENFNRNLIKSIKLIIRNNM